jgi:hypothetical protein
MANLPYGCDVVRQCAEADFDERAIRIAPAYLELTEGEQAAPRAIVRLQFVTVAESRSQFHSFASNEATILSGPQILLRGIGDSGISEEGGDAFRSAAQFGQVPDGRRPGRLCASPLICAKQSEKSSR